MKREKIYITSLTSLLAASPPGLPDLGAVTTREWTDLRSIHVFEDSFSLIYINLPVVLSSFILAVVPITLAPSSDGHFQFLTF